jgi:hypothetical protein
MFSPDIQVCLLPTYTLISLSLYNVTLYFCNSCQRNPNIKLKITPGTAYFAFKLYIVAADISEKPLDSEACNTTVAYAEENALGNGFGIKKKKKSITDISALSLNTFLKKKQCIIFW